MFTPGKASCGVSRRRAPEATGQGSNSIIDALRRQLAAKDTEITKLRARVRERNNTIATLYGQREQYQS
jgi:hypothetical protein